MKSTLKISIAVGASAITGAIAYGTAISSWHSLIDAAADQAIARRVNDMQSQLQFPKILRIGANGGGS